MTINKQRTKKAATKTPVAAKKATGSNAKNIAPAIVATESGDERIMVPLRLLTPSKDNVRRFTSEAGIEELCANVAAMGLLQNLRGRRLAKGKLEIGAGARRLRALSVCPSGS
jgi:ParB-like nuclease domain